MEQRMGDKLVETIMGAIVLFITGGFLYFAFSQSSVNVGRGTTYYAVFDKVGGLAIGGEVKISGIKVGTVMGQRLDPDTYSAIVEINIDSSIKLPEDTFAKITSEGLLGGNYMVLDPGGSDELLAAGGQIIDTQGSVDFLGLLDKFAGSGDEK